jgi:two-component system sensor histidine kinase LytS
MENLTIILFERMGLLLIFAFMLTRIPYFRYLLDRELGLKTTIYHSVVFGIFAIAGAQAGVVITEAGITAHLWMFQLNSGEMLVSSGLVAVVIAGLLGGPYVGLGTGLIVAVYLQFLGGEMVFANSLVNPLAGLLAGLMARFFSQERVIAPGKALFIGMFIPILHMALLLISTNNPEATIELVNTIGIPLVVTNSVAIAVFTAMIRVALTEKEQEAAIETKRALNIAEQALPHLKQGFHAETATKIAHMLHEELKVAAVSLTDTRVVLAHVGLGDDHHRHGEPIQTGISRKALESENIQIAHEREQIQCADRNCRLEAAIIVPIRQSGEKIGLIKLYFRRSQQIRAVETALAQGLGKLISHQLDAVAAEKLKVLIQEAELRNLQAQINPHFLFNTLHSIDVLIRRDPKMARHLIVQLGYFMRSNIKLTSESLISLDDELKHLKAYLEIVKVRFADQLTIRYDIEEGLTETWIPPFTLQPLVENSIQHGLKNVENGGEIIVRIRANERTVKVEIQDNGGGISDDLISRLGSHPLKGGDGNGMGIYNVNQRLIGLCGDNAHLQYENRAVGGCVVFFHIPISNERGKRS